MVGMQGEAPQPQSVQVLELKLKGLQEEAALSSRRAHRLAFLAAALVVLLLALVASIHLYRVLQYASMSDISAEHRADSPLEARISYTAASSGKVDFTREDTADTKTITAYVTERDVQGRRTNRLRFGGRDDRFTLSARYREGLFFTTKELLTSDSAP